MAIVRKTLEQIKQTPVNQHDLDRLNALQDSDIDYSDIPPLTEKQIANLKPATDVFPFFNNNQYKPVKQQVTLRIDSDILAWLKKDGKGYQTRANQLLRQFMLQEMNHN